MKQIIANMDVKQHSIIVFSRTSTTAQDVEQQTKELINEATRLGYSEKNQIIVEYQESGIKLDINTRQGIRKLKETIISNPNVDCVICWELTRIARSCLKISNFFLCFDKHSCFQ